MAWVTSLWLEGTSLQDLPPLPSSLPVGAAVTGRLESCALPPLLLLGCLGMWPQPLWPGTRIVGTISAVSLVPPPLCVPIYPCQMHRCMDLSSILLCWAEEPLLSYGCLTRCRLKGIDKGTIPQCYDAAITHP